jgi:GNAT superfamily N-acetyltransferase
MTVRNGTFADIEHCLPLAELFWSETGHADHIPYDADSTADYFKLALNHGLFIVATSGEEFIGFGAGVTANSLVNRSYKIGAELAWWIRPEFRGGPYAIKIMKMLEKNAEAAGCALWSMMLLETSEPEKVQSMYLRMGYSPGERTFSKRM